MIAMKAGHWVLVAIACVAAAYCAFALYNHFKITQGGQKARDWRIVKRDREYVELDKHNNNPVRTRVRWVFNEDFGRYELKSGY